MSIEDVLENEIDDVIDELTKKFPGLELINAGVHYRKLQGSNDWRYVGEIKVYKQPSESIGLKYYLGNQAKFSYRVDYVEKDGKFFDIYFDI